MSFLPKRSTILFYYIAIIILNSSTDSFTVVNNNNTPRRTKCMNPSSSSLMMEREDNSEKMKRRDFLFSTATGLLTLSQLAIPDSANAVIMTNKLGGLSNKIRQICVVMDELQRDLMQEQWDLVETYPIQLRSFVPAFTAYTDTAFPSDIPTDKSLRVALRYEVGRFFASLERLRQACSRRDLDDAYIAYSDMALHFDRYLHTGGLYTYQDDTISTEPYFQNITDAALVYSDPKKDPAEVRDLIILISGPDKGKTGILIGIYKDGSQNCVVKLDKYRSKYGIREIRVVPKVWVAKRLGEQDPDAVFLIPRKMRR